MRGIEAAQQDVFLQLARKQLWDGAAAQAGERIMKAGVDPTELFYGLCRRIETIAANQRAFPNLKARPSSPDRTTKIVMRFPATDTAPEVCGYASAQYPSLDAFRSRQHNTLRSLRGRWESPTYARRGRDNGLTVLGSELMSRRPSLEALGRLGLIDDIVLEIEGRRVIKPALQQVNGIDVVAPATLGEDLDYRQ